MNYYVTYGQTIYDIVLATYKRFEYTYKLLQDNPFIDSVDYDFDANPGAVVSWDETFFIPPPEVFNLDAEDTEPDTAYITATEGQSVYDLVLMTYGDLKYTYKLLQDNNIVSLNNTNLSGKKIIFNPKLINDIGFYNHLINKKKVVNTIFIETQADYLQTDDGIFLQTDDGIQIQID